MVSCHVARVWCLMAVVGGRFQIFARVDGRILCRNGVKRRRESME